jgi:hypothetical protein
MSEIVSLPVNHTLDDSNLSGERFIARKSSVQQVRQLINRLAENFKLTIKLRLAES